MVTVGTETRQKSIPLLKWRNLHIYVRAIRMYSYVEANWVVCLSFVARDLCSEKHANVNVPAFSQQISSPNTQIPKPAQTARTILHEKESDRLFTRQISQMPSGNSSFLYIPNPFSHTHISLLFPP